MNPKWSPFVQYFFTAARCLDRNLKDSGLTPSGQLKLETEIEGERFLVIQQNVTPIAAEKPIFAYEILHIEGDHKREYVGLVDLTMKTETLVWPETPKKYFNIKEIEKTVFEAPVVHEKTDTAVGELAGGSRR